MSRHDHDVRAPTPALERARNREHERRRQHAQVTGVPPSLDVHVDDLADGELVVDTVLPAAVLSELLDEGKEVEWTAASDARVALRLEREAGFVRVRGKASFGLRHPCVRCLASVPFEVPLDVDLRLVRKDASDAKVPDAEHSDEDLDDVAAGGDLDDLGIASFAGDTIHLAEVLREQLFLELPMHPACDSPRARPTAPCAYDAAGALKKEQERWVDPRWAGLAKLKDQLAGGTPPAASAPTAEKPVPLPGRQTLVSLPGRTPPSPAGMAAKGATTPAPPAPITKAPQAPAMTVPAKMAKKAPAKKAKKAPAKKAKKAPAKKAKKAKEAKKAPAKKAKKAPARKAKKAPARKAKKAPAKKAQKAPAKKGKQHPRARR